MPLVKLTGERVMTAEGGFNPTWQRHVAAYALADGYLPPGRLLDLGCGVGHSYHLLEPRETVGVDISPEALVGQERETVVADMRELPFADGEFASVLSVQSLEHVPDPERVIAEVARVLRGDGTAMFVTPNRLTFGRSDEIIDPYHFREFASGELAELCGARFGEVRALGLFGSPRYMELFDQDRAKLERLLAKDPLRLRRLVPLRGKQWLYDTMLERARGDADPRAAAIEPADFEMRESGLETALDVVAVCTLPTS
jgi:SAM-dependent methyltransferase